VTKQKASHKIISEFIFWLHTLILLIITFLGLFVPWGWVVLVLILLRAQQVFFHGCILTLWEVKERKLKKGTACFYLTFKRFFGIRLTKKGVYFVSIMQNVLTLVVAIMANIFNIRIHL